MLWAGSSPVSDEKGRRGLAQTGSSSRESRQQHTDELPGRHPAVEVRWRAPAQRGGLATCMPLQMGRLRLRAAVGRFSRAKQSGLVRQYFDSDQLRTLPPSYCHTTSLIAQRARSAVARHSEGTCQY